MQALPKMDIGFKTKPQIDLKLLDKVNELGVKHSIVLADSFFCIDNTFIERFEVWGETYTIQILIKSNRITEE